MSLDALFLVITASLLAVRPVLLDEDKAGTATGHYIGNSEAINAGGELYLATCSSCHGVTGEGGRGPNLITSRYLNIASDDELFDTIKNGAGGDMPPWPVADEQVWQVTAFVRNLGAPALRQNVDGEPEAGKRIYYGKGGCSECHMIRGEGGYLGPDLTNVGINLTLNLLREAVFEPNKRFSEGFSPVIVTLADGRRISGSARNNSNYSIQIIAPDGRLYLLEKLNLLEVNLLQTSWMPADYDQRLSDKEASDLIAFLSHQTLYAFE